MERPDQPDRPDRPVSGPASLLRQFIRSVRLIRWRLRLGKRLELGRNVTIGPAAVLVPPRRLAIRDNVGIARGFHVEVDLEIGPDVLISSQVAVVGKDHRFDDPTRTVYWAGRLPASPVVLEGDNLIGFGTIIVGPCRIGRGCIVGAGSVVTGDLPPDSICVGVPARAIRPRYPASPDR